MPRNDPVAEIGKPQPRGAIQIAGDAGGVLTPIKVLSDGTVVISGGDGGGSTDLSDETGIPGSLAPPRGFQILGTDGIHSRAIATDSVGRALVAVTDSQPTSAVLTPVAQTTTSVTLAAANPLRRKLSVTNDIDRGLLFLKIGLGASPSDYSFRLLPYITYTFTVPVNTEAVSGAWSIPGGGFARVTEET